MKIENVRPCSRPANAKGFRDVGQFNVRITPDVLLYDMVLVKSPFGKLLLYAPPTVYGAPSSSIAPALRAAIIESATTCFRDEIDNDRAA